MHAAPHWHVRPSAGCDIGDYSYRLELERGETGGEQVAYVDVQAFEDRAGDARLEVLGEWPLGDALGREAADALRAEAARHESALAAAVLDGHAYVLDARRAA
jgi:hypothetical protein